MASFAAAAEAAAAAADSLVLAQHFEPALSAALYAAGVTAALAPTPLAEAGAGQAVKEQAELGAAVRMLLPETPRLAALEPESRLGNLGQAGLFQRGPVGKTSALPLGHLELKVPQRRQRQLCPANQLVGATDSLGSHQVAGPWWWLGPRAAKVLALWNPVGPWPLALKPRPAHLRPLAPMFPRHQRCFDRASR